MNFRPILIAGLIGLGALVLISNLGTATSLVLTPEEQLGKELFFDNISDPPSMSCAACHAPEAGWTGAIPGINLHGGVYRGAVPQRFGDRKPPSNAYVTMIPIFHRNMDGEFVGGNFWDGRATGERLGNPAADQALGPYLNPVEQNMPSKRAVCEHVQGSKYAELFREVWGAEALDCSTDEKVETMYDNIGLSVAAYEASHEVIPFSSKYDYYWNACIEAGNDPNECGLAEGSKEVLDPKNLLSDLEFDGLIEFGEYCSPCHVSNQTGPNGENPIFSDFTFENIGVPKNPENPFYDMDQVFLPDGSAINPLGADFIDFGLGKFLRTRPEWETFAYENDGKFKVPTVRNVAQRRGPGFPKAYMHNGVFKTLEEVVHFYNTRDVPEENWPPPEVDRNVNREILEGVPLGNLELDAHAEAAIVAFLEILSDKPQRRNEVRSVHTDGQPPAGTSIGGDNRLSEQVLSARIGQNSRELLLSSQVASPCEVKIFNVAGRAVRSIGPFILPAGTTRIVWNGKDEGGRYVGTGVYFYEVKTPHARETLKGILIR